MPEPTAFDLDQCASRLASLRESLQVDSVRAEIGRLEAESMEPGFWDDSQSAQAVMQRISSLRQSIAGWEEMQKRVDDVRALAELLAEEEDESLREEFEQEGVAVMNGLDTLELETLLAGEHDAYNAILDINAGAGGTESCDWASMLLRMYLRWAQDRGYRTEILDEVPGDVAGIKSVTVRIEGRNAYGYLQSESGVHRLVRISPFDSNARRHTSFTSVDVVPELEEVGDITISPDEIRLETFRASTAGGQHMQKNETAVRIIHLPTGLVVTCQNERSQAQNRESAMKVLLARLAERERRAAAERLSALRGDTAPIEWGHQIRSYVFQPYYMVKDHRTDAETGNVPGVMDGDIDLFIQAYLRWKHKRAAGRD